MILALDSSAVLTWILQEPRWRAINGVLTTADLDFVLPGPALTEVVAIARAKGNSSSGQQILLTLIGQNIEVAHIDDPAVLLRAAELQEISVANPYVRMRGGHRSSHTLSHGDSLILAMCEEQRWPVITGDKAWQWHAQQGDTTADVRTY